ncbi:Chemotaxis response regulator protein-glutamate methylesterase of group 2 operon [Gemmata obscuriglobus]|uniref:Protein-glutamate methylesterase/protein-glutamine glutaminase n=1 Tax=Gemmata obscuriglobus TaxID=114 RepID=A0A2Z3GQU2_9BACT|nr:chemotaxis-specific protein-glutamate methyltransferase CheB [Gemmata obscuriglobus]AWM35658.1 chemotaxis-specific protein-glutamate methyltransferase CheB [Gemmata obscuriglobus]QEG31814.1 Chemotaxis response regulator protein-glutamate methylesterase of group 2 operon [Gemmata obscuriglobus]VTS11159.1 chemotaxis protein : Chemotaxis response regulator protein-glutamate methylesterase OS=Cellvibrio sp. BR GN=cheB PE=3 SV=1: Response_reg: CheB_methylest [Gemmata obscuriglobus UQM 2246]
MAPPIRVLIVDDSPTVCRALAAYLAAAPGIEVAGLAHSGEAALARLTGLLPHVVTLDLDMPGMGGLAALERLMATRPTPVLLLSGLSRGAAGQTVEGLALGAVDVLTKYAPGHDTDPAEFARALVAKVRTAAGVKTVRSLPPRPAVGGAPGVPAAPRSRPAPDRAALDRAAPAVLVIGASTGGPPAVRELLAGLPAPPPFGVLLVQHLPARFTRSLAELLARQTGLPVREAGDGEALEPGTVLVAPGDRHAVLGADGRVRLNGGPAVSGHRPSIDVAMESAARAFRGRATGVLLTGMGEDGARGLAAIRAGGGRTFAQDEDSSAVYGMPLRAVQLGAVDECDTPAGIAARLAGRS